MSWIDRLAELYELLIGLGVAIAVLAVVAWFVTAAGGSGRESDGDSKESVSREPPRMAKGGEAKRQTEPPTVAALYLAPSAGRPMERRERVDAVAGRGLVGDRYFLEKGHWSGTDGCEVTIIAQEDLDEIEGRSGLRVQNGEHRRNLVIRGLPIGALTGNRFRIGSAIFGYERPRPPCAYIQLVSEPGMAKALGKDAGICVRCIRSGEIREGDKIEILNVTPLQALRYRTGVLLQELKAGNRRHG